MTMMKITAFVLSLLASIAISGCASQGVGMRTSCGQETITLFTKDTETLPLKTVAILPTKEDGSTTDEATVIFAPVDNPHKVWMAVASERDKDGTCARSVLLGTDLWTSDTNESTARAQSPYYDAAICQEGKRSILNVHPEVHNLDKVHTFITSICGESLRVGGILAGDDKSRSPTEMGVFRNDDENTFSVIFISPDVGVRAFYYGKSVVP